MTTDAWLAIAHHLAVFGLLAVLAAEWGLVRPGLTEVDVARIRRFDAAYGACAGVVLVAGVTRVLLGAKPESFYVENPVFWLKMASFAAVGLLSVRPTLTYGRWAKGLAASPRVEPDEAAVRSVRRQVLAQLALFPLIPAFAAVMARGIGL